MLMCYVCSSQTVKHQLDTYNCNITFEITHLGLLTVNGSFREFNGVLEFQQDQLFRLDGIIKVESINTYEDDRDKILRSPSYLDVIAYPEITFLSNEVDLKSRSVSGVLAIKDQAKKIIFNYQLIKSNNSGKHLMFKTTFKRSEFKLDFGSMDSLIGDRITVLMEVRI